MSFLRRMSCALALGIMVLVSACEGPAGPAGPTGPQGPQGPQGAIGPTGPAGADGQNGTNGTNGQDGQDGQDAQVIQYNYPAWDYVDGASEVVFTIPQSYASLATSVILSYTELSGTIWYPIPGYIGNDFEYRAYTFNSGGQSAQYYVKRVSGTGTQSFSGFRILIVPAITITNGSKIGVDFSDYEETMDYLNQAH